MNLKAGLKNFFYEIYDRLKIEEVDANEEEEGEEEEEEDKEEDEEEEG